MECAYFKSKKKVFLNSSDNHTFGPWFFESITSEILKDHLFARCNICIEAIFRSSHPEVFLGKDVLKICSKFTGEHPCRSAISITLLCIFFIYKVDAYIQSTLRTPPGGCF